MFSHSGAEEESEKNQNVTEVHITLDNELVTYVEEYFTYDLQSFIGEIGGTFGLFLGVSMLTSLFDLFEFILHSIKC